jgi:hypothetical protein
MNPLELIQLPALIALTSGSEDIVVALLDGPVVLDHPDLFSERIHDTPGGAGIKCSQASSSACQHGTFVAGILSARRGSAAPAMCPGCSLLVRPIFSEKMTEGELLPHATAQQLAAAIGAGTDCDRGVGRGPHHDRLEALFFTKFISQDGLTAHSASDEMLAPAGPGSRSSPQGLHNLME